MLQWSLLLKIKLENKNTHWNLWTALQQDGQYLWMGDFIFLNCMSSCLGLFLPAAVYVHICLYILKTKWKTAFPTLLQSKRQGCFFDLFTEMKTISACRQTDSFLFYSMFVKSVVQVCLCVLQMSYNSET